MFSLGISTSAKVAQPANTRDQARLGDFPKAIDDAVMENNDAQQEMIVQHLSNPCLAKGFARVVFDMLKGA